MDPEPTSSHTLFGGNKICRSCLKSCENPINLYSSTEFVMDKRIKDCFEDMCNLQISQEDNLPETICDKCNHLLVQSYMFRYQARKNDDFLRSIVEGNLIEVEELQKEDNIVYGNDEVIIIADDTPDLNVISQIDSTPEPQQPTPPTTKPDESYPCQYCHRVFSHKRNLKTHEKRHFDNASFECLQCNKQYYTRFEFNRHLVKHTQLRPFRCTQCEKSYMSQPELNRHIRTHSAVREFPCNQCEKEFTSLSNLGIHISTVHKKERKFECEHCGKRFQTLAKVRRHQSSAVCNNNYYSDEADDDYDLEEEMSNADEMSNVDELTPVVSINLEGILIPDDDAQIFNEEHIFGMIANAEN